ncbi:GIY-YIG nuclease family protein [uncultured Sphingomonas sp.]|uniref:GIY-YIG nuclease family protein n=1 Tax=uncultured Sphingomonas sp. TaxID=158754 RepID=UPI0035C973E1
MASPDGGTMFVGLYQNLQVSPAPSVIPDHLRGGVIDGAPYDVYTLDRLPALDDLRGRLHIDWPIGRNWRRLATKSGYDVREIRTSGQEPPYPGHSAFLEPLSAIEALPPSWKAILRCAYGIYSLTCPRDRVHYVGMAEGADGFFGRWMAHAAAGGDAIGFRDRPASDYLVGILEVAGSFSTTRDIAAMEERWKLKLQSRSFGINRN